MRPRRATRPATTEDDRHEPPSSKPRSTRPCAPPSPPSASATAATTHRSGRGQHTHELWAEAGKLGYLGVNLPEEYGGGGGGIAELSIVLEELGAAGCPLLMMVVSPAICGTVIARFGTEEQKRAWLPGLADGTRTMAFGITEPDAGSNSHRITTTARRDGAETGCSPAARSSSPASTSPTPP